MTSPSPSEAAHLSAEAQCFYIDGCNSDLAPILRLSRLQASIKGWNSALSKLHQLGPGGAQVVVLKNIASAHRRIAELTALKNDTGKPGIVADSAIKLFHFNAALDCYGEALLQATEAEVDNILARSCDTMNSALAQYSNAPLRSKLSLLHLPRRLDRKMQANAMLDTVNMVFNHGVSSFDASIDRRAESQREESLRLLHEAKYAFEECEGPLADVSKLLGKDAPTCAHLQVAQLSESVFNHRSFAEARISVVVADGVLNAAVKQMECLDMEGVWAAVDLYRAAELNARGNEIETEAIAIARRGKVYAKVFRNEDVARPLLHQAVTLAAGLAESVHRHGTDGVVGFRGVKWYDEALATLKAYQDRTAKAEESSEARRRQADQLKKEPVLQKLKPVLDKLHQAADKPGGQNLLKFVYLNHPPRCELYTSRRAEVDKKVDEANADTIKKVLRDALLHYHSDKNRAVDYGLEWEVLCEEITKQLVAKYSLVKAA